jgi:histidinol phosphatase-like enzyme
MRKQTVHADGDGGIIIKTEQDVSEIIEANKEQLEFDKQRTGHLDELHHVARIPFTVIDVLNQRGIMRGFSVIDDIGFARWLNDPENAVWKTYRGTI